MLATRTVIPQILALFDEFSIHASWATVGFLFARSRKEAEAFSPQLRPGYSNPCMQAYLEQLGTNEHDDPFHFAPSLIQSIARHAGQEIASHSFSHYYCMEDGQRREEFEADLQSAIAIAANSGYTLKSYVFPRNQLNPEYLHSLHQGGFTSYRANQPLSGHKAASFAEQRRPDRRIVRLVDTFVNLSGDQTFEWPNDSALLSIPASHYLRRYHTLRSLFEPLLISRIEGAIRHAAVHGKLFHLWWHPEDFALYPNDNLRVLRRILELFVHYRDHYQMSSLTMGEVAQTVQAHSPAILNNEVA
jgi:peptidoglycan/xylan/chitin deacetylase (PgdA/CDA1 family)